MRAVARVFLPVVRRMWLAWGIVCLVAGLTGCMTPVPVPFRDHDPQAVTACDAQQLVETCWLSPGQPYLCRHSGLLRVIGREVPLNGLLRVEADRNSARLVALDDFGVKLFDLSVTSAQHEVHYLFPPLEAYPQLTPLVAESMRRIFLHPLPESSCRRLADESGCVLAAAHGETCRFVFGGQPAVLQRKYGADWQVDYYQYQGELKGSVPLRPVPQGIILQGRGYDLTLWLQEVRTL
ncbi:MAG: hypothetical protein JXR59_04180 [Desulfuromonadaceae bacterium]|nr:hypothetical protein [Desulfuromonadaceae bacterium]